MQHLKPTDMQSKLTFANWIKGSHDIADSIWFLDEAHFTLNGQVNKQNLRYRSSDNATVTNKIDIVRFQRFAHHRRI